DLPRDPVTRGCVGMGRLRLASGWVRSVQGRSTSARRSAVARGPQDVGRAPAEPLVVEYFRGRRGRRDASAPHRGARVPERRRARGTGARRSVPLALLVCTAPTLAGGALRVMEADRAARQERRSLTLLVGSAAALARQAVAIEHARAA